MVGLSRLSDEEVEVQEKKIIDIFLPSKELVLLIGRMFIDFVTKLELVIIIVATIVFWLLYIPELFKEISFMAIVVAIIVPILLLTLWAMSNYYIYLLIDINDNLRDLNRKP